MAIKHQSSSSSNDTHPLITLFCQNELRLATVANSNFRTNLLIENPPKHDYPGIYTAANLTLTTSHKLHTTHSTGYIIHACYQYLSHYYIKHIRLSIIHINMYTKPHKLFYLSSVSWSSTTMVCLSIYLSVCLIYLSIKQCFIIFVIHFMLLSSCNAMS